MLLEAIVQYCNIVMKNICHMAIIVVIRHVHTRLASAVEVVIIACITFISQIGHQRIQRHYMIVRKCCVIMFASILTYMLQNCFVHFKAS